MACAALLTRPEPFHGCNGLISNKHATVVSHQGEKALEIQGEYGRAKRTDNLDRARAIEADALLQYEQYLGHAP